MVVVAGLDWVLGKMVKIALLLLGVVFDVS